MYVCMYGVNHIKLNVLQTWPFSGNVCEMDIQVCMGTGVPVVLFTL